MYLKRYRMPSVAEALARAREELGADALVLATRLVRARGISGWLGAREVEVTAAAPRRVSDARPWRRQSGRISPPAGGDDPIVARLAATGVDEEFAREVANLVPALRRRGASPDSLCRALADRLQPLAAGKDPYAPVEVFVGPAGAGKTTMIAKIAAQERVHGRRRVSLVAADTFRVGAVEQLRLYADIVGADLMVARSPEEMDRAFDLTARPVLVDTAGRSPRDEAADGVFGRLAGDHRVRTHLVLPATTTPRDARRILERYTRASRPDRIALTRLDETDSLSPLLGVLRSERIPVSYLGCGQRVPEDLQRATAPVLAACMLGETTGLTEES